jgi:hypothetical protein
MHGFGGGYNHGSLLPACIFREAGSFSAQDGWNHMRFLNGSWVTARLESIPRRMHGSQTPASRFGL